MVRKRNEIYDAKPRSCFVHAKFMTIVEVCIALALIAVYSLGYQVATIGLTIAFCLSGMFYWVNIWFIFVAFALMNGSGRAVGLDRWVIPWIQRKLGKAWYGTRKLDTAVSKQSIID